MFPYHCTNTVRIVELCDLSEITNNSMTTKRGNTFSATSPKSKYTFLNLNLPGSYGDLVVG